MALNFNHKESVQQLLKDGLSARQISVKLGLTRENVEQYLFELHEAATTQR